MVILRHIERQAPLDTVSSLAKSSRARKWQARWATNRPRCSTSGSSKSTPCARYSISWATFPGQLQVSSRSVIRSKGSRNRSLTCTIQLSLRVQLTISLLRLNRSGRVCLRTHGPTIITKTTSSVVLTKTMTDLKVLVSQSLCLQKFRKFQSMNGSH